MKNILRAFLVLVFGFTSLLAQPVITQQPTNQVVPMGSSASVNVTATGANLSYQWFKDRVRLVNQTNSTLNFASFQFINGGSYSLVVSNAGGLAISLPALLSVPNAPLLSCGDNWGAQLGNGTNDSFSHPDPINVGDDVVVVAAGNAHSLFVKNDGTLWGMGNNSSGVLGNGTTDWQFTPVFVTNNVVAVAAGYIHSLFVKSDGSLWAMGYNADGELGNGTKDTQTIPVVVASNVVAVAAGEWHSLFLKSDGTLWAMGYNVFGQLGNGNTATRNIPVVVASNVVAVAAGGWHSLFVKSDGTLWAMGYNGEGQLGNGTTTDQSSPVFVTNNVVAVAGGDRHSLFVKSDGTLWAMGWNLYGQLGGGNTDNQSTPVMVSSNVAAVAAGDIHSVFVKRDGSLWAMGDNEYGQLGNGTTNNSSLPLQLSGVAAASLGGMDSAFHTLVVGAVTPQVSGLTNNVVLFGQSYTYNPVVGGSGPFTYQWQFNGTNILNATNSSYTLANAALTDSGTYSVTVTGLIGSANQSAALTVNILPGVVSLGNVSRTNGGLQLTVQLNGSPNYPYILQTATNLTPPVNWQSILTNPADGNGNWSFTVTNLPAPAGFYRAIAQ
jgi:alpha-tubulin suppressor-like RCC1 family protein